MPVHAHTQGTIDQHSMRIASMGDDEPPAVRTDLYNDNDNDDDDDKAHIPFQHLRRRRNILCGVALLCCGPLALVTGLAAGGLFQTAAESNSTSTPSTLSQTNANANATAGIDDDDDDEEEDPSNANSNSNSNSGIPSPSWAVLLTTNDVLQSSDPPRCVRSEDESTIVCLQQQADGDLVVEIRVFVDQPQQQQPPQPPPPQQNTYTWSSDAAADAAAAATDEEAVARNYCSRLQGDGNLVTSIGLPIDGGDIVWKSGVVDDPDGTYVWVWNPDQEAIQVVALSTPTTTTTTILGVLWSNVVERV